MQNLLSSRKWHQSLLLWRLRFRKPRKGRTTLTAYSTSVVTQYRVTPGLDKTRNTTNKTFFHFKVQGFRQCTIKFIVGRVYLLEPLYKVSIEKDSAWQPDEYLLSCCKKISECPFWKSNSGCQHPCTLNLTVVQLNGLTLTQLQLHLRTRKLGRIRLHLSLFIWIMWKTCLDPGLKVQKSPWHLFPSIDPRQNQWNSQGPPRDDHW